MAGIGGVRDAGIRDLQRGLDGQGGDWHTLGNQLTAYADSLSPGWKSGALTAGTQHALTAWIQQHIQVIRPNLQLDTTVGGERNSLLPAVRAHISAHTHV